MRRLAPTPLTLIAALALAACSNTATAPPAASSGASSQAPAGSTAAACTETKTAGAVTVTMENLAYSSTAITTKVGQAVTFMNKDTSQHTATLDDNSCTTATLNPGESDGLVFSAPGSYPFHCTIHPTTMKGTITVTG